jgi:hypothetical protein
MVSCGLFFISRDVFLAFCVYLVDLFIFICLNGFLYIFFMDTVVLMLVFRVFVHQSNALGPLPARCTEATSFQRRKCVVHTYVWSGRRGRSLKRMNQRAKGILLVIARSIHRALSLKFNNGIFNRNAICDNLSRKAGLGGRFPSVLVTGFRVRRHYPGLSVGRVSVTDSLMQVRKTSQPPS